MFGNIIKTASIVAALLALTSCDSGAFIAPEQDGPNQINGVEVASITLDAASIIVEDDTVALHATVLDGSGSRIDDPALELEWTSSDQNVATISAAGGTDGELISRAPGTTTLTVSYDQISTSETIEVHNRPIDLVYVTGSGQQAAGGATLPDSLTVQAVDKRGDAVGGVYLTFAVTAGGGSVSRSSGTTGSDGVLRTAWTLGTSGAQQVRALASSAQPRVKRMQDSVVVFTASVTDTAFNVSSVTVTPDSATVDPHGTVDLDAQVRDSRGNAVNSAVAWASSDTTVAHVDVNGLVTAVAEGEIVVSATVDGVTGTSTVTVAGTPEGTLSISASADTLYGIGDTLLLTVEARSADGTLIADPGVQWSSSNPDIATVDTMGMVTARALGVVVIAASAACCSGDFVEVAVTDDTIADTTEPAVVSDLAVAAVGEDSVTLQWTQVDDGTGNPANYVIRYGSPSLDWGAGYIGEIAISGSAIGHVENHVFAGLTAGTTYEFGVVSYRGELNSGATFGQLSDFVNATTSVTAEPSLSVTPSALSLTDIGDTASFAVEARQADGSVVQNPAVSWTSLDTAIVTVDGNGMATARALGTALIVASSVCCGDDTAAVSVGQGGLHPHEPEGFSVMAERDWSSLTVPGWLYTTLEGASVEADPSAPVSPEQIVRITYPEGYVSGYSPGGFEVNFTGGDSLYAEVWIRQSANWHGHSTGVNKILYLAIGDPNYFWRVVVNAHSEDDEDPYLQIRTQVTPQGERNIDPNLAAAVMPRGQWHHIEVLLVANTRSGAADGEVHWWLNGTKVGAVTDLEWWDDQDSMNYWHAFQWHPVWGGANDVVPAEQFMEMDHAYVSSNP